MQQQPNRIRFRSINHVYKKEKEYSRLEGGTGGTPIEEHRGARGFILTDPVMLTSPDKKSKNKKRRKDRPSNDDDVKNYENRPQRPLEPIPPTQSTFAHNNLQSLPNLYSNHDNKLFSYHPQAMKGAAPACEHDHHHSKPARKDKGKDHQFTLPPEIPKDLANDLVEEYDSIMQELESFRHRLVDAIEIYEANVCSCKRMDCGCFKKTDSVIVCPCDPDQYGESFATFVDDESCEHNEVLSTQSLMPAMRLLNRDKSQKNAKFREVAGMVIDMENRRHERVRERFRKVVEDAMLHKKDPTAPLPQRDEHEPDSLESCCDKRHRPRRSRTEDLSGDDIQGRVIINIKVKRNKTQRKGRTPSGELEFATSKERRHYERCHKHDKPHDKDNEALEKSDKNPDSGS